MLCFGGMCFWEYLPRPVCLRLLVCWCKYFNCASEFVIVYSKLCTLFLVVVSSFLCLFDFSRGAQLTIFLMFPIQNRRTIFSIWFGVVSVLILCNGNSMMDSKMKASPQRTMFLCKNGIVGLCLDNCGEWGYYHL